MIASRAERWMWAALLGLIFAALALLSFGCMQNGVLF